MNDRPDNDRPDVVVVGGGLAGLAAAAALARGGARVCLLEARPRWGGRASSLVDAATGDTIDNCQHVSLGCCTHFARFCRTLGLDEFFSRESRLHFVGPDGRQSLLKAWPLPPPWHLAPSFLRLKFLSPREKLGVARGLFRLARSRPPFGTESFLQWLLRHGQSEGAIARFWHLVLVSALSESVDRIDVGHARKVFLDAFLNSRKGYEVWLPTVPLDQLYGQKLRNWFAAHGVDARLQCGVRRVVLQPGAEPAQGPHAPAGGPRGEVLGVELRGGQVLPAQHVVLAVPPHLVEGLLPAEWAAHPYFAAIGRLEAAPISSVHLWFDRPICRLRHAALVGRLSQWVFHRTAIQGAGGPAVAEDQRAVPGVAAGGSFYYQVVISASREVAERPAAETIGAVLAELRAIWPGAAQARVLHQRLITEHKAVTSMTPGIEALRPVQQSPIANLQLAGDYTQTGWPCTMEGAVRSGELAAENILARMRPA